MSTHYDSANVPVVASSSDMTPSEIIHAVMRLGRTLYYRRHLVLGALGVTLCLGVAYYLTAPRIYQSTAKLLINERSTNELSSMGEQMANENLMANQRETLLSPVVIREAIDTLLPEHQIDLQKVPRHLWIENVANRLAASASRKGSFIEVSYRSRDPEAAAGMVSAIVNSYLAFVDRTHKGSAGETIEMKSGKLAAYQQKLAADRAALQELQQKVGHLVGGGEQEGIVDPTVQRALEFHKRLLHAEQRRLDLQARMAAVNAAMESGRDLQPYLGMLEKSVGEQMLVSALGMSDYDLNVRRTREQELVEARNELQRVAPFLAENHPQVLELQTKVVQLEEYLTSYPLQASTRVAGMTNEQLGPLLQSMLQQALEQVGYEEQQVDTAYQAARSQAAQQSQDLLALETYKRDIARLETQCDSLVDQIAEIDTYQAQGPIQAVVVKEPLPNERPVSPKLKLVLALSVVSGCGIGAVLAYVQDVLDDRFNSPEELSAQLDVPVLTLVPQLEALPGEGLESIHTYTLPHATDSESFRTLRTAIALNTEVADIFLVSSAEPSDGKTTVSANLAVALAQAGKRTLIIDADLRRPGMTALLKLKGVPGVMDILSSDQSPTEIVEQYVQKTVMEGLDVLPAGLRRPNPSELLSRNGFVELLAWASTQYDQVLVDCPPVLAVSDAQIVGRLVDGAILVVQPEKNHRRLVARACEQFRSTGSLVIGIVANNISSFGGSAYGYGYGYGYSYGGDDESHDDQSPKPIDTAAA